jgi:hypothetical protein
MNEITPRAPADYSWMIALILLPIVLHVALLAGFAEPIPWVDDYFWYFRFLDRFQAADGFGESLRVLFTPYNNHWHIFQRLFIVPVVAFWGSVPLLGFMWLGNVLFLVFFYCFTFRKGGASDKTFLPQAAIMSWLCFQPVSSYNFFECAFFNLPVFLFVFLAIEAYANRRVEVYFWAVLATASNGNGMLVWLILGVFSLRKKEVKRPVFFVLIFALLALANRFLSRGQTELGPLSFFPLHEWILYYLQVIGSVYLPGTGAAAWWGLKTFLGGTFIGIFLFIGRDLRKGEQGRWYFLLFLLATVGLVTTTRKELNGYSALIVAHYLLFPQLLWAGILSLMIGRVAWRPRQIAWVVLPVVIISTFSYFEMLPLISGHKSIKLADAMTYQEQSKVRLYNPIQGREEYERVNLLLENAIRRGDYRPPVVKREFLPEPCVTELHSDESVSFRSELRSRMLTNRIFIEITDVHGEKTYLPAENYANGGIEWLKQKKARQVYGNFQLQFLLDPIASEDVAGCRVVAVK